MWRRLQVGRGRGRETRRASGRVSYYTAANVGRDATRGARTVQDETEVTHATAVIVYRRSALLDKISFGRYLMHTLPRSDHTARTRDA